MHFAVFICKNLLQFTNFVFTKMNAIHAIKYFSCIKLIPKKKQALVEFDDVESAKNLVESSQVCDKIIDKMQLLLAWKNKLCINSYLIIFFED